MEIPIKLTSENAKIPVRLDGSAGYDLFASEECVIPPLERCLIKTGVKLEIPLGYYGHISDRSGMAYKNGGHCMGKIIDPSYRGEIGIVLFNSDKEKEIKISIGDRPAQILFKKYENVTFSLGELSESVRQDKGFGSSGK